MRNLSPGKKRAAEKGALDIIEEVFHLLRVAPFRAIVFYYLGALPFVLGLLYFWADMSRSAFAYSYVARGSLVMALLFVWMKGWQSVYARELMAHVRGDEPHRWGPAKVVRLAVRQAVAQSWGLFVLPVALVIMLPFGWVYACFQNMTVLDDGEGGIRDLFRKSSEQARLWPKQNHLVAWALSPCLLLAAAALFLAIIPVAKAIAPDLMGIFLVMYGIMVLLLLIPLSPFGMVIAMNISAAILLTPQLLKMLFGAQTIAADNPLILVNGVFYATVAALTYLCMDPLVKAAYVLRCFYGNSLKSGEDLLVELRRLKAEG